MIRVVNMKLESKQEFAASLGAVHLQFRAEDGTESAMKVAKAGADLVTVGELYAITVQPMSDLTAAAESSTTPTPPQSEQPDLSQVGTSGAVANGEAVSQ